MTKKELESLPESRRLNIKPPIIIATNNAKNKVNANSVKTVTPIPLPMDSLALLCQAFACPAHALEPFPFAEWEQTYLTCLHACGKVFWNGECIARFNRVRGHAANRASFPAAKWRTTSTRPAAEAYP
jgi:hypothetical protein